MEGGWLWMGPYVFILGKYGMAVCLRVQWDCLRGCVCVCLHLAQSAYIHHAMALWQRVGLRQLH